MKFIDSYERRNLPPVVDLSNQFAIEEALRRVCPSVKADMIALINATKGAGDKRVLREAGRDVATSVTACRIVHG